MINPEDDVIIDLSTSCTQEEAVIKLLGWSRGPLLRKAIKVTSSGISEDQMPFIRAADLSLQEQLLDMRGVAQRELIDAASNDASDNVLEAKEAAVRRCEDLIRKAFKYSLDISDELNKKVGSEFDIDTALSKDLGGPYITLTSLDQWGRKKYGISILNPVSVAEDSLQKERGLKDNTSQVSVEGPSDPAAENSSRSLDSLYTTFAFLLEEYAKRHPKTLLHTDGSVNESALASELYEIICAATGKNVPLGQGDQSIRKRIITAGKVKREMLKR